MAIELVDAWLKACDLMLQHYKGKIELIKCPLCEVAELCYRDEDNDSCDRCIWVVFENKQCDDYLSSALGYHKLGGWEDVIYLRENRVQFWVDERIYMLKKWMTRLREMQGG